MSSKKIIVSIVVVAGISFPAVGQIFNTSVNVPSRETEVAQAEKLVSDQLLPPPSAIYEAQTEAYNRISALQSYIDTLNSGKDSLKKSQATYSKNLQAAKEAAQKCDNPSQVYGLIRSPTTDLFDVPSGDDQSSERFEDLLRQAVLLVVKTFATNSKMPTL